MQESHPQTGIDLTYIAQSGDTSAPPAYADTGGDRYVGLDQFGRVDETGFNAQNQITNNSGSTTPTYDNNGNVTKDDAGTTYTYTAWNRMATTSSSSGEHFTYLPGGPQASVSLPGSGSGTYSFYSTAWQDPFGRLRASLEDFVPPATGGTGPATTYVWGLENVAELVARDDTSGVRLYAQHDPNMDITALVNTSGSVVNRLSYTPSGAITILNSSWGSGGGSITLYTWDYYWQGGRYDYYDGLYSFGYRNYSPTLGTWMEEDPTGYAAGPNVYQAMLGAPIEKTDPYGLDPAAPTTGPAPTGGTTTSGSGQPTTNGSDGATQPAAGPSGRPLHQPLYAPMSPRLIPIIKRLNDPNPGARDDAVEALENALWNDPDSLAGLNTSNRMDLTPEQNLLIDIALMGYHNRIEQEIFIPATNAVEGAAGRAMTGPLLRAVASGSSFVPTFLPGTAALQEWIYRNGMLLQGLDPVTGQPVK